MGGAFQVGSLGLADLDVYAGVRNYFRYQENANAFELQAGLDLILTPKIIDTRDVVVRPVVALGIDFERQTFDTMGMSDSVRDTGILIAGALQVKPTGSVLGIPIFGDIGVVRTLSHYKNVTEMRARLHVHLKPNIVRGDGN